MSRGLKLFLLIDALFVLIAAAFLLRYAVSPLPSHVVRAPPYQRPTGCRTFTDDEGFLRAMRACALPQYRMANCCGLGSGEWFRIDNDLYELDRSYSRLVPHRHVRRVHPGYFYQ